jgi:hypothetical protein
MDVELGHVQHVLKNDSCTKCNNNDRKVTMLMLDFRL